MPLDFISQSRIWSSEDLCSKETFAFGENHAVRLRKIPPVDRSSQSQSQSCSYPTCLVRVGPTGPCHWSFGNKWGGACILEYLCIYSNWCSSAVCFQLSQAKSGKFNPHVHVEYEWNLRQDEMDESDDDLDDKVSVRVHAWGCCALPEFLSHCLWNTLIWSLLGATSQLDNRTNGKMRNSH